MIMIIEMIITIKVTIIRWGQNGREKRIDETGSDDLDIWIGRRCGCHVIRSITCQKRRPSTPARKTSRGNSWSRHCHNEWIRKHKRCRVYFSDNTVRSDHRFHWIHSKPQPLFRIWNMNFVEDLTFNHLTEFRFKKCITSLINEVIKVDSICKRASTPEPTPRSPISFNPTEIIFIFFSNLKHELCWRLDFQQVHRISFQKMHNIFNKWGY